MEMDGKNIPMLTWIIPVYNGEKYLAQAINSILRQPCGDFQIIVVDDGSTDKSLEIARSIQDDRIQVVHKENGGVSSARNVGIELANSKYIAFLDADDVICKNAYDEKIRNLLCDGQYDLVSFNYYSADQRLKIGNMRAVAAGEGVCDAIHQDPFKHVSSFVYRNEMFLSCKELRFPEGIKIREDVTFLFLVYCEARKITGIEKAWFLYRNNIGSVLHKLKGPEYLIRDVIPAWHWCKCRCKNLIEKNQCDVWLFSEATSYIEMACNAGVGIERIKEAMMLPAIQEALEKYEILWNGRRIIYEEFYKNPKRYWLKQRMKGIVLSLVRFMVRLPLIRSFYINMKYKEKIDAIA